MKWLISLLLTAVLFYTTIHCKKGGPDEPYPTDSLGKINRWILDSMRRYYYWSDDIPANYSLSQPVSSFFKSLLSVHDRFSWISNGADITAPSNSYFIYGFHYAFVQVANYEGYIGVITLVNKGGAANRSGLERGHFFSKVNGAAITSGNIEAIKEQLKHASQLTLTPAKYENNAWVSLPDISLRAGFAPESPIHYTRSFTAGGITTGYLFYHSFDESYDAQLVQAIGKLKKANVGELILDLRYNAGGSVASSAKLAAMLAGALNAGETYTIYEGNKYEGRKPRSLQAILNTSGNNAGKQYTELQANKLSLQRVFILTTTATVSAAELIVNNLKPFMTVIQIGETTAGKDEASFLIEDLRIPQQVKWKLQPTVYKLFNKNSEGGYHNGIGPQYPVDEMTQLPLYGIGELNDPLVGKALQIIYGNNTPGGYTNLRRIPSVSLIKTVYRSAVEHALLAPDAINP